MRRFFDMILVAGALALAMPVTAQTAQQEFTFDGDKFVDGPLSNGVKTRTRRITAEQYKPTIWVDPDGCEHWVMDDGFEGFMTNHLDRHGRPVCRQAASCATFAGDGLFATGKATLNENARARVAAFFSGDQRIKSYIITGHTDSRADTGYNLRLSKARAQAVANVAASMGARVKSVRAAGEGQPKASNATPQGRASNRRVDIICVR